MVLAGFFSACSGACYATPGANFEGVTCGAGALSATAKQLEPTFATVEQGVLKGSVVGGVAQFLGVPYARPPARFEAPQPPAAWTGPRDATRLRERCAQMTAGGDGGMVGSEDCLYLNVL